MWRLALGVVLACCVLLSADAVPVLKKIDAPCTACKAVAAELQRRIDKEPVRNHLDLRHRLDKDGQRYGKVIAYRSSELRAVELLDGLCDLMRDYSLVSPRGKRTKFWLKVKGDDAQSTANVTRPARDEEDDKGKRLEAYCGSVMEELEEEIYAGIMKGGFDNNGVEAELCLGIISPCPVVAVASGGDPEGEDDGQPADGEAAQEPGAEDAVSGGASGDGTRYIENMTIQMGENGNFEL